MWIKESYISRIFRDLGFAIYYYCIIERWLLSKEARYTKSFFKNIIDISHKRWNTTLKSLDEFI